MSLRRRMTEVTRPLRPPRLHPNHTRSTATADQASPSTPAADRFSRGAAKLREIDGEHGLAVLDALADVAPDLGRYVVEFAFGDTYSRPDLDPRQRQLVTIGMLTAPGGAEPQLKVHVHAALNVGLAPEEVVGAIIHAVPYVGFPRALNAMFVAKAVFAERGLLPLPPGAPAA